MSFYDWSETTERAQKLITVETRHMAEFERSAVDRFGGSEVKVIEHSSCRSMNEAGREC